MTSSVVGPRRSSKSLTKAKHAPKKGPSHYLVVCCWSDPLQLSESQQNHYIWEVCSANQWDALKTTMPTAGIGQQNGHNTSSRQCLTAEHVTQEHFKSWTDWATTFDSSAILSGPLANRLPLLQASWQLLAGKITSTTSRMQKFGLGKQLSKSLLNPEARIFMPQK